MKFRPYALCPHTVAFQVDGLTDVAAEDVTRLVKELPPSVGHLFVHLPWHSQYETVDRLSRLDLRVQIHVIANTVDEAGLYQDYGLPVQHGPASMYVSEHLFHPQELPATHTALCVGNFRAGVPDEVKRQFLAREIPSLRVITYPVRHDVPPGQFDRAFHETFPELRHAQVNATYLTPEEMRQAYNEARVSLALSAAEGCMYALTESLLCGTPAVSTPAMGGREQYFIAPFVVIADPDPASIAEAVKKLAALSYPPHRVRRHALAVLQQHRASYCRYVEATCRCDAADMLHRIFLDPRGADRLCFDFARTQPYEWCFLGTGVDKPRQAHPASHSAINGRT